MPSTTREDEVTGTPVPTHAEPGSRLGPILLRIGALAAWAYVSLILILGSRPGGFSFGLAATLAVFLAGCVPVVFLAGPRGLGRIMGPARMADIGIATMAIVVSLFLLDTAYTAYENWNVTKAQDTINETSRLEDYHLLHGEIFPRAFYPTDAGFKLYKPNVRVTAPTFGGFYTPKMLASPTLVDSVLELRSVTYAIGPHGFRETESLAAARVFALGDSFVLGYASSEGEVWTDVLGELLGRPVYNLGLSGSEPRGQLAALEHLLETQADSVRIEHLLWMVFEGNDLEDTYVENRADTATNPGGAGGLLEGTVVQALSRLPGLVRYQSVARRLQEGTLTFGPPAVRPGQDIDGVRVYSTQLFHSGRLGYKLFRRFEVERPTKGPEYVLQHPNRAQIEFAFREMKALSERHGFAVTVLVAPSSSRLHGPAFDGFPTLSERPYFIDYVVELSANTGFPVVNLLPGLQVWADRELLYYRDDHHWNPRGNELVARLIAASVFGLALEDDRVRGAGG